MIIKDLQSQLEESQKMSEVFYLYKYLCLVL